MRLELKSYIFKWNSKIRRQVKVILYCIMASKTHRKQTSIICLNQLVKLLMLMFQYYFFSSLESRAISEKNHHFSDIKSFLFVNAIVFYETLNSIYNYVLCLIIYKNQRFKFQSTFCLVQTYIFKSLDFIKDPILPLSILLHDFNKKKRRFELTQYRVKNLILNQSKHLFDSIKYMTIYTAV